MENVGCLSFSTLKKHMTPLGNMEWGKIQMIWTSGDVYPFLFKTFHLRENLESEWGHPSDFYDQEMGVPQGSISFVTMYW